MNIVSLFCVGFFFIHWLLHNHCMCFSTVTRWPTTPRACSTTTEKKFRRKAYEKKGKNVSVKKFCSKACGKCRQPYKSFLVDSSLTFHFHLFISQCVSLWPPFHVFYFCLCMPFFNVHHFVFVYFFQFLSLYFCFVWPLYLSICISSSPHRSKFLSFSICGSLYISISLSFYFCKLIFICLSLYLFLFPYLCMPILSFSIPLSLHLYISLSLYLSIFLSLSISVFLSCPIFLSFYLCLFLHLCISFYLSLSLYLSISLSLFLSLSISVLRTFIFLSLCLFPYHSLSLYLSISVYFCISACLSFNLSICVSFYFSLSLHLSIYLYFCISVYLSISLSL